MCSVTSPQQNNGNRPSAAGSGVKAQTAAPGDDGAGEGGARRMAARPEIFRRELVKWISLRSANYVENQPEQTRQTEHNLFGL
ncbi:hypothetical protein chiPu_0003691 [Chiloscyllium punctatum]|uniref:Uncharacterized protein n=1 Tax=Chiloscyllium punctatum TaxID=137246 RepID=A0A401S4H5_CHIPU|nr:hypothetical protein [Chiloscyllium punctatum]